MNASQTATWIDDPSQVLRQATRLRIAHHLPGRVRLKLSSDGIEGSGLAELQAILRALRDCPGIASTDINTLARSCLILYDTKEIQPSTWVDLVGGIGSPEAMALVRALAESARRAAR
jgi:hypothetical protein